MNVGSGHFANVSAPNEIILCGDGAIRLEAWLSLHTVVCASGGPMCWPSRVGHLLVFYNALPVGGE